MESIFFERISSLWQNQREVLFQRQHDPMKEIASFALMSMLRNDRNLEDLRDFKHKLFDHRLAACRLLCAPQSCHRKRESSYTASIS